MKVLTQYDGDLVADCRARGEFFWLDLVGPDAELLAQVGEDLGWNPLLTEDLEHGGQRPKIEDFANHTLVVCYAALADPERDEIALLEHGIVVHGDYVVTVRPTDGDAFARLRTALATNDTNIAEATVVHRVLDLIVDTTMHAADAIAADVEHLQHTVDTGSDEHVREELQSCRRALVNLRGVLVAQRDAFGSLAASLEAIPDFELGMRSHFRDVTDHAHRVVDRLEVSRDLLDAAFEAYNTDLIARQGAITQRLTVIATIFLPLTFVTGFFGQNFAWLVQHVASETDFLVYGVGTTVLTAGILAVVFRRLQWW